MSSSATMLSRFIPKGQFSKNVLILLSGTVIAQAIPVAISPLLTRLYTPTDFGVFALYMSVVSIVSIMATGRYEYAIMLPRKDSDAANIAALSSLLTSVASIALLLAIALFSRDIAHLLGNERIGSLLVWAPVSVLLTGIYVNLNFWCNRKQLYSFAARRRVIQSGATGTLQIAGGSAGAGSSGMVFGGVMGQAIAVAAMGKMVRDTSGQFHSSISLARMIALGKKYISFPKLLVPAYVLNTISSQLPIFFINTSFGVALSGHYLLMQRVVSMPVSLIANAVSDVFWQRASKALHDRGECTAEHLAVLKRMIAIGIVPFTVFTLLSPQIFALVFGETWRRAGEYAQIMAPMFFIQFVTSPLSCVATLVGRNKYDLMWQLSLLVCVLCAVGVGALGMKSERVTVTLVSLVYGLHYLADGIACYRFSRYGRRR